MTSPRTNNEDQQLRALGSFVPAVALDVIMRRLKRTTDAKSGDLGQLAPFVEDINVVHMWIDLKGFTVLAEQLHQQFSAAEGEEILTAVLNEYFTAMNSIIEAHHGCIFKIAGDAISVIWNDITNKDALCPTTFLSALDCAVSIQRRLHNYHPTCRDTIELSCKVAIGAGPCDFLLVGGYDDKYETVLHGDPLEQTNLAVGMANAGDIVLSMAAFNLLRSLPPHQRNIENFDQVFSTISHHCVRFNLHKLPGSFRFMRPKQPVRNTSHTLITPENNPYDKRTTLTVLRQLVPGIVCHKLSMMSEGWISELRQVSVVFILLTGIAVKDMSSPSQPKWSRTQSGSDSLMGNHYDDVIDNGALTDDSELLSKIQDVFSEIQKIVGESGGMIRQFILDDKGPVCIAVYGMPAHGDDAERSILASMRISQWLNRHQVSHSVGVTTGRAFCGSVGSSCRREFAIVGDTVNLSARLMEAARNNEQGTILCDGSTMQGCRQSIVFQELKPISVKGKTMKISLYNPVSIISPGKELKGDRPFVGRESEGRVIRDHFQSFLAGEHVQPIVIHGEKGMGKSRFIREFLAYVKEEFPNMKSSKAPVLLCSHANNHECNSPLFGFRTILRSMLTTFFPRIYAFLKVHFPRLGGTPETERAVVRRPRAPAALLHQKTGSQLEMTVEYGEAVAKGLEKMNRILVEQKKSSGAEGQELIMEQLSQVFYDLFERLCHSRDVIIVVDDVHWMDQSSWNLLRKMTSSLRIMIMVTGRPNHLCPQFDSTHKTVHLQRLEKHEVLSLLTSVFHIDDISSDVIQLVWHKSEGNPYFAIELFKNMIEQKRVSVHERRTSRSDRVTSYCHMCQDDTVMELPATLEGVITARIDHLPIDQLEVLKAASIIGNHFTLSMLQTVLNKDKIQENLEEMKQHRFVTSNTSEKTGEVVYTFTHSIIQEVVYKMIPFSQKRTLQESINESGSLRVE